jgi:hypothetical protein
MSDQLRTPGRRMDECALPSRPLPHAASDPSVYLATARLTRSSTSPAGSGQPLPAGWTAPEVTESDTPILTDSQSTGVKTTARPNNRSSRPPQSPAAVVGRRGPTPRPWPGPNFWLSPGVGSCRQRSRRTSSGLGQRRSSLFADSHPQLEDPDSVSDVVPESGHARVCMMQTVGSPCLPNSVSTGLAHYRTHSGVSIIGATDSVSPRLSDSVSTHLRVYGTIGLTTVDVDEPTGRTL